MATDSARVLAVQRLLRVESDDAHVARLADGAHSPEVSRRAVDYVSGVTRLKRWLDFLIGSFYRGKLSDLDPELLQILRIGTYDLVVREVAPHAAVNEAVEAAKEILHQGAGSVTNGVLRAIDRARQAGDLPEPDTGDLASDLAIRFSHPTWPIRRWLERWGEEATRAFLEATNHPGRFTLRVTAGADAAPDVVRQLAELGVEAELSPWAEDFLSVDRLQPVLRSEMLDDGTVSVQDVAAGLVVRVLDPHPGERILDGAAAPGGKAIYAALQMDDEGEVVAVDVSEAKVGLIAGAARRQGATIVRPVKADLTTWDGDGPFDRVLLDAPCSGSGVLAKRADLRWRRSPEGLAELADLQDALLGASARHVRLGGLLIYSTCSVEPEENDERVAAFLERHPEFTLEPVATELPDALVDGPFYRALPHVHGTDGAFAARLRRSDTP